MGSSGSKVATLACQLWYDEVKMYSGDYSPGVGHFTQMVWKSSERLGIGQHEKDGMVVVVGIYDPRGNIVGKGNFPENVLPKK